MHNLTKQAREGFDAAALDYAERRAITSTPPYLATSPNCFAWEFGYWLFATHRSSPRGVRMSRGYTVRGNDMLCKWIAPKSFARIN
jgi:hypothetical protein